MKYFTNKNQISKKLLANKLFLPDLVGLIGGGFDSSSSINLLISVCEAHLRFIISNNFIFFLRISSMSSSNLLANSSLLSSSQLSSALLHSTHPLSQSQP